MKRTRRALLVAAIAVATIAPEAVGVVPTSSPSSSQLTASSSVAASLPSAQVRLASYSITPHVQWHWWGVTLYFNQTATGYIAAGYFGGLGWVVAGPGGAIVGSILSRAADDANNHGNCIGANVPYSAPVQNGNGVGTFMYSCS